MTYFKHKRILALHLNDKSLPKEADIRLETDRDVFTFDETTGTMQHAVNNLWDVTTGKWLSSYYSDTQFESESIAATNAATLRDHGPETKTLVINVYSKTPNMFGPFYHPCVPPPSKTTLPFFKEKPNLVMRIHESNACQFLHHIFAQTKRSETGDYRVGVFPQADPFIRSLYGDIAVELPQSAQVLFEKRLTAIEKLHPEFKAPIAAIRTYLFKGNNVSFCIPQDKGIEHSPLKAKAEKASEHPPYFSEHEIAQLKKGTPFYLKSDQTTHLQLLPNGKLRIYDAGNPNLPQIIEQLTREGLITTIGVTISHAHSDHCEVLPQLVKDFPAIPTTLHFSQSIAGQIAGLILANPVLDGITLSCLRPDVANHDLIAFQPTAGSQAAHFIDCSGYIDLSSPTDEACIYFGDNNPPPGAKYEESLYTDLKDYLIKGFTLAAKHGKKQLLGFFDEGHYFTMREQINVARLQSDIQEHFRQINPLIKIELLREHEKMATGTTKLIPAYFPRAEE